MQQKALVGREAWFSASVPWPPPIPTAHLEQVSGRSLVFFHFFFFLYVPLQPFHPGFFSPTVAAFAPGIPSVSFFFFFSSSSSSSYHILYSPLYLAFYYIVYLWALLLLLLIYFFPFEKTRDLTGLGFTYAFSFLFLMHSPAAT